MKNSKDKNVISTPVKVDSLFPVSRESSLEEIVSRIREHLGRDHHGHQSQAGSASTQTAGGELFTDKATVLSLEEVIRRVRNEVDNRRKVADVKASSVNSEVAAENDLIPRWRPSTPRPPVSREYMLGDLLKFADAEFIDTAYQVILRRPADPAGREHYLAALRSADLSKVEILGSIRFSPEGMQLGTHIDGLLLPYKLQQWSRFRFIGPVLSFTMALFRLPSLAKRLVSIETSAAVESQAIGHLQNRINKIIEVRFVKVERTLHNLDVLSDKLEALISRVDTLQHLPGKVEMLSAAFELQQVELRDCGSQREQYELELRKCLNEQIVEMAELKLYIQAQKEERDQHESAVLLKLSEQASITRPLVEGFHSFKSERENHDQYVVSRLSEIGSTEAELIVELNACKSEFERQAQETKRRLSEHDLTTTDLAKSGLDTRRSLLDVQRKLISYLDRAPSETSETTFATVLHKTSAGDEILNAQYVAFEDKFRGERADIKTRAAHYLANLAAANVGTASGLVLDLGCGRGEWLEVLTEQGFSCRGVDLNSVMLEDSLARGFDAVEADALEYLRGLADNSLAAITSMHLVEHLTHNVLIRLLDEALRVLQPGGVLILETPNPENITVGSCWFYLDPTHRNPIPPALLQWTVQERGFERPAIERLSENRGVPEMVSVSEDIPGAPQINQLIEWFVAPPDYAVIARKPKFGRKSGRIG